MKSYVSYVSVSYVSYPVWLSAIHTKINWKKVFAPVKISTSVTNIPQVGNSWIFYPFKPFSTLEFAKTKWFFHGTCSGNAFLPLLFFSQTFLCYFYHEKDWGITPGARNALKDNFYFMSKIEAEDLMMGMRLFSTKLLSNGRTA